MSSARAPGRRARLREVLRSRGRAALLWGVVSGLVAAGVVAACLWFAPVLRVATVEYRTDPARLAALEKAAPPPKGKPLVEVDTGAMRDAAMATQVFDRVVVERVWPSTLVVTATPRRPVVAVTSPGASGVRLVDRDGLPYESVPGAPRGVPQAVVRTSEVQVLRSLATVVTGLDPTLRSTMSDLEVDAAGRLTMTLDGTSVTWGDASDSRVKAAVVRSLVGQKGVARIDVSAPMEPVTSSRRDPQATRSTPPGDRGGRTGTGRTGRADVEPGRTPSTTTSGG